MYHFFIIYQDFLIPLLGGLLLDALIGDPHRLPHPIRLFGRIISWCDRQFNRGNHRKAKGVFVALGLVVSVFAVFTTIEWLLDEYTTAKNILNTILFFFAIANRSLISEAMKVEKLVMKGDIPAARKQLSWIVGRDTSRLTAKQIRTATLETLAENLSDGVIAPLFFYALGGIPLIMAYKMVNTMDSMIGYKNEKYRDFGWFAARILDDTANFIPARLTALLMVLVPPSRRGFRFIRTYAKCHSSPNSGYPESALAGILDCRFGGPNVYQGKLVEKPYIGENDRDLTHADVRRACFINLRVTMTMMLAIIASLYGLFHLF
ncbi:adenosylcobinamide-phosphate synthase CbiB [uncultured Proteiniphilum sp.]|mgnify:FL=1|uniref:adenosylcobinamide-phosphate synthase CbiB n=1 Tax=uncultured Proteiniphilum sp. TaxID=497637 RepID=UPI002623EE24|nr:adenosylcobinamide-phosphate synthase CbiB [uncultured Proteiniphilum sp.]